MDASFDQVVNSYHRARTSGNWVETFYRLFLAKSPEIPPMFAHTDFPHQRLMLRQSLLEMLAYAQSGAGRDVIERLAERHRALNVKREHYQYWLDALCESLAQHDPQFNAHLEQQWRRAMQLGIAVMLGASGEHQV